MIFVRLLPILGVTFIDILGFSIMIALMPFFVIHFGASPVVVGLTFTIFAVCQFFAGPLWGHVSDRVGRKRVLIISQIGAAVSWIMLAFAPNLSVVFAARMLEGFSGGNLSITHAYVADVLEPEKRAQGFAYVGAAFSAGMVFGPAMGGLLYAQFGYTAPFLAAALLQLLTLLATIFGLPESREKPADAAATNVLHAVLPALRDVRMAPVLWQRLFYALGLYGWFSVFTLILAAQLHLDAGKTSYVFAFFGAASFLFEILLVGQIAERIGDRNTANAGLACCLITFALAPFVHTYAGAGFMLGAFAVGLALVDAALPALLTSVAPVAQRGTILGVGSSLESFAGILMPPLATGIFQFHGPPATALLSALLVVPALIIGLHRTPPSSAPVSE